MGCGCNKNNRAVVANLAKPISQVLSGVSNFAPQQEPEKGASDRVKIEKLRRDALLRALGRP